MSMNKKIRVLHVAEAAGGVERYLETLFKYNDDDKVENILVCSQNYDYKKFATIVSRVIVLKMTHGIDFKDDIKVEKKLRSLIRQLKPDIVYAHSSKAGAFARISNLGLKNKVIYNPHGWAFNMDQSNLKKKVYREIEKISAYFCDKIVCISDAERTSALTEKICKPNKLQVIYNGIDLDEIKSTIPINKEDLGIPKNAYVIGMVGRLSDQKAPDIFVKAAKLIKEKIPNAYFIIVGDGKLRNRIEHLISIYKLESSFLITGWVDKPSAYMKIMDIGMLLSRWEGFGLVLPEYMTCGVPSIATDVDTIPNIIKNKKNGLLVKKDDYAEVVKKVIMLADNLKLRNDLIAEAKKSAIKFSGQQLIMETYRLLYGIG